MYSSVKDMKINHFHTNNQVKSTIVTIQMYMYIVDAY